MRVTLLLRPAIVGDVDLTADDRLDSGLSGLPVELDGPREGAVIGECDRRHLELGGPGREVRDATSPVEDRVLGMDVKMDERRFRHGHRILAPRSDGSRSAERDAR
jgi:hypothetical protein